MVPSKPALIKAFCAALHCFFLFLNCSRVLLGLGLYELLDCFLFSLQIAQKEVVKQVSNLFESSIVDNLLNDAVLKTFGIIKFSSSFIFVHILLFLLGN